jgi:hypothetical protein
MCAEIDELTFFARRNLEIQTTLDTIRLRLAIKSDHSN